MVKMVSLSNKAYSELKDVKNKDESFSDVILRLLKNSTKDIKRFAGILKDDKSELDWMEERISEDRKNNKGRFQ
jgi:predicted CopG family antitoxin